MALATVHLRVLKLSYSGWHRSDALTQSFSLRQVFGGGVLFLLGPSELRIIGGFEPVDLPRAARAFFLYAVLLTTCSCRSR